MSKRGTAQNYDNDLLDDLVGEVEQEEQGEVHDLVSEETVETDVEELAQTETEGMAQDDDVEQEAEKPAEKTEDTPKRVPLSELMDERGKRQALQAQLEETNSRMGKYDTLWERLEAAEAAKAEEAKPQAPDYEEDPVGNLKHQQEQITEQMAENAKATQEQQQQAQQSQRYQQMQSAVAMSEQTFASENDDYYEAVNHLRGVMRQQMEPMMAAQGITDPTRIGQILQQQEANAAMQWLQSGVNPAEYAYNYAKTVGYQRVDKSVDKSDVSRGTEELDRAEKGLKAAKGSGSGGSKKVTKSFVDDSGLAEFNSAMDEMFGSYGK